MKCDDVYTGRNAMLMWFKPQPKWFHPSKISDHLHCRTIATLVPHRVNSLYLPKTTGRSFPNLENWRIYLKVTVVRVHSVFLCGCYVQVPSYSEDAPAYICKYCTVNPLTRINWRHIKVIAVKTYIVEFHWFFHLYYQRCFISK